MQFAISPKLGALPVSDCRKQWLQTYERRKLAALEVERLVHDYAAKEQFDRVILLVDALAGFAVPSAPPNTRKGGLLCLAAVAVGLVGRGSSTATSEAFLNKATPPIIAACTDSDSRIRYYALEALYNLAKSTRPAILREFASIFDVLLKLCSDSDIAVRNACAFLDELIKTCVSDAPDFDVDGFLPVMEASLAVECSQKRQFLLNWLALLDALPSAELRFLSGLPRLIPGVLDYLEDSDQHVRQSADKLLRQLAEDVAAQPSKINASELASVLSSQLAERESVSGDERDELRERSHGATAMSLGWLRTLVASAPTSVASQAPAMLRACLRCLDTGDPEIQAIALQLNEDLYAAQELLLEADGQALIQAAAEGVTCLHEVARLEALRWTAALLHARRKAYRSLSSPLAPTLLPALCDALTSTSDRVVRQAAAVLAVVSTAESSSGDINETDASHALTLVIDGFRGVSGAKLLQRQGMNILEQLCREVGPQSILLCFSKLLAKEEDFDFARMMSHALGLLLLTSSELQPARDALIIAPRDAEAGRFFIDIFPGFCASTASALSLALLAGAYDIAADMVASLAAPPLLRDMPATVVELSQLVSFVEAPAFAPLRLHLLSPRRHAALLRVLCSLLALLPQGEAFDMLQQRIACIPGGCARLADDLLDPQNRCGEESPFIGGAELLQKFITVQERRGSHPSF